MNSHTRQRVVSVGLCVIILGFMTSAACADTKGQITDRMAQRLGALNKAKADGKIGETFDGLVEAVKAESLGDKELKKLVQDENADRKAFYELGAKEVGAARQTFALSAGKRNFRVAKPNEWLKPNDGKWIQKKDLKS
ncbi:MAG: YdbL family protein [Planctomycetaceae bacterium]|nr:YdbL family protein [Planctomycetaceae bacterium]